LKITNAVAPAQNQKPQCRGHNSRNRATSQIYQFTQRRNQHKDSEYDLVVY